LSAGTSFVPDGPVALTLPPEVALGVACPLCHTPSALSEAAIESGAYWRCARCSQHWDRARLVAVAAYAATRLARS
jgi:hypothetical protein